MSVHLLLVNTAITDFFGSILAIEFFLRKVSLSFSLKMASSISGGWVIYSGDLYAHKIGLVFDWRTYGHYFKRSVWNKLYLGRSKAVLVFGQTLWYPFA